MRQNGYQSIESVRRLRQNIVFKKQFERLRRSLTKQKSIFPKNKWVDINSCKIYFDIGMPCFRICSYIGLLLNIHKVVTNNDRQRDPNLNQGSLKHFPLTHLKLSLVTDSNIYFYNVVLTVCFRMET